VITMATPRRTRLRPFIGPNGPWLNPLATPELPNPSRHARAAESNIMDATY